MWMGLAVASALAGDLELELSVGDDRARVELRGVTPCAEQVARVMAGGTTWEVRVTAAPVGDDLVWFAADITYERVGRREVHALARPEILARAGAEGRFELGGGEAGLRLGVVATGFAGGPAACVPEYVTRSAPAI